MDLSSMKVVDLRNFLKSRGAVTSGNKEVLLKRARELSESVVKVERNDSNNADKPPSPIAATPEDLVEEKTERNGGNQSADEGMKVDVPSEDLLKETMQCDSPMKRKMDEVQAFPQAKRIRGPPPPKNPVMILNEIKPGLKYNLVESSGAPHNSNFVMEVEYNGQKYTGSASTKKLAKQHAAADALRSFVQFQEPHKVVPFVMPANRHSIDFTADTMDDLSAASFPFFSSAPSADVDHSADPRVNLVAEPPPQVPVPPLPVKSPKITPDKNPVMLLNELHPGLQYECVDETGLYQSKIFTMQVVVNGNSYQGYGKNKKLGKVGAAIKALRNEFGVIMTQPNQEAVPSNAGSATDAGLQVAGNLCDLVHQLIHDRFSSMTDGGTSEHAKHKVLAGIVMTKGGENEDDVKEGEVISLATGTKCVSGEYISDQGSALFDCHAEIVSRRGLRRFLYQQLLAEAGGETTILERVIDGGFRVKSNVKFHLYINTSPCGDSRIFSPHETPGEHDDSHPNRRSRGLLRTKIENGEGTIPVEEGTHVHERGRGNVQQTWDAIISGERLLTMSCSDKLAKWNVVGMQGSLLTLYIEPIYLTSIILGSLYHATHLERGVFTRANDAVQAALDGGATEGMPHPYKVHRPLLAAVPNPQKRIAKKAPTFCLHWTFGDDSPQIINTTTGRTNEGDPSNLCKLFQMKQFLQVASCKNVSPRVRVQDPDKMTYAQLKNAAKDYQAAKYLLMTGLHKVECGSWVGKPIEVDAFSSTG